MLSSSTRNVHRPAQIVTLAADLIAALTTIMGASNAPTAPSDTRPFTEEWRGLWHGKTPLVLKPKTTAEVAAILKLANDTGTPIIPQSATRASSVHKCLTPADAR